MHLILNFLTASQEGIYRCPLEFNALLQSLAINSDPARIPGISATKARVIPRLNQIIPDFMNHRVIFGILYGSKPICGTHYSHLSYSRKLLRLFKQDIIFKMHMFMQIFLESRKVLIEHTVGSASIFRWSKVIA